MPSLKSGWAHPVVDYDYIRRLFLDFRQELTPSLRMYEHPTSGNILLVNLAGGRPIVMKFLPIPGAPGTYQREAK